MQHNYFDSFKGISLLFLILIAFIGIWLYLYYKIYIRNSTNQTVNDIEMIVQNIAADTDQKFYNDFSTDVAVLGEYLPYDLPTSEDENGHFSVTNRFGGQIYFFDSVADKYELAQSIAAEQYGYNEGNMGAYIIKLTRLSGRVCRVLAQVDWAGKIPNFLGLETGGEDIEQQNKRPDNLHNYILSDNKDEIFDNEALFHLSRQALSRDDARQACECGWHKCFIALKFK